MKKWSLFRYPGGKSRQSEFLLQKIRDASAGQSAYCEPFVGGGSVFLRALQSNAFDSYWLNDLCPLVSAFWSVLLGPNDNEYQALKQLMQQRPDVDLFRSMLERPDGNKVLDAYRGIFLNRCSHNGRYGASPIGGWNQAGRYKIDCRWNAPRLIQIMDAVREQSRVYKTLVSCQEACQVIVEATAYVIYCDPPYVQQGNGLYRCSVDHTKLHAALSHHPRWILSYDDVEEIRQLYNKYDLEDRQYRYSLQTANKGGWQSKNELIICKTVQ